MKKSGGNKKKALSYKTFVPVLIAVLITAFFAFGGTHNSAFVSLQKWFAAGDVPAHEKTLTDNHDGTHQLELSVTGDAETEIETAANVNVIIVYDHSSSMTSNVSGGRNSRADQAEDVVYDFVHSLFSYQSETNPNNIQMALVTFARTASVVENWTVSESDINDHFDDGGTDGTTKQNYSVSNNANNGTNWQAALASANTLLNSADSDPTFVVFVTDGAPTASGNGNNAINPSGASLNDLLPFYREARTNARNIQSNNNVTLFGIYAYGTEADLLDDLIYYSNTGRDRDNITAASVATTNYYNAGSTAQLTEAIESIFQQIVEALGVSSVTISDGTTANVQTTSGQISHLLSVDEESYRYWLSIPVVNNQFSRVDLVSGDTVTYTVRDNNNGTCTVTWGSNSINVNGSVSGGQLKYEWTAANALYNYNPPTAVFNSSTGAVDWNLSSVGTLLDGVTYSVTFDVFPSQETYDIIADLKNEKDSLLRKEKYDNLDANIKKYLEPVKDTDYTEYTLRTNTTATLSYRDTRNNTSGTATYDNPDPVGTDASTISIHKEWKNNIPGDPRVGKNINVNLQRDDENFYPATLTGPNYSLDKIYIATGLAKLSNDGELRVLDTGHDYKFAELGSESYNWELDTETVHPMLINNVPTKLIKIEESEVPSEMGEKTYYNDGENKYYHLKNDTKDYGYYIEEEADPQIKAINNRRSNLNITKTVNTSSQQATAPTDKFTFTIDVDMKDEEGKSIVSQDNTYHNDYLWFSVAPVGSTDPIALDTVPTDWQKEDDANYYYAPNGTSLVIEIPAGYNIRFTNLPTNTTFDVTEGDLANYVLESLVETTEYKDEATGEVVSEEIQKVEGTKTISGTIEESNRSYTVEATNKYEKVDIEVEKEWQEDDNGSEGLRTSIDVALKANGTQVDTCTLSEATDWKCSFTKDRFQNEREITYTVEELTDLTPHYITTYDGFKIINTRNSDDVTTKASVFKVWDDDRNHDGFRPTSLQVQLNDEDETVVTLNSGNEWKATVEDLPKYANGQEVTYTWTELNLPSQYTQQTPVVTNIEEDGKVVGKLTTITNKHESVYINIPVEKVWTEDDGGAEGLRIPITVELLKGTTSMGTKTLNSANDWKAVFEHLAQYENGQEIEYTLAEVTQVPHYKKPVISKDGNKIIVTNEREDDKTIDIPVEKIWVGDNNDEQGLRTPITVTLKNGNTTVGTKTLSASNNWKDKFTDLPKYENGAEIEYTLTENYTNPHYRKGEVEGSTKEGFTVTNTRIPDDITIKYTVKKIWDDSDDQDGIRPDSITVTLTGTVKERDNNGNLTDTDKVAYPAEEVTVSKPEGAATNEWSVTVENLPKYADGQLITYTISEEQVDDYDKPEIDGNEVTNPHNPFETKVTVIKKWDDKNDQDGLRDEVTFMLTNDKGLLIPGAHKDVTFKLTDENVDSEGNWVTSKEGLPRRSAGEEIEYSVVEISRPAGYTAKDGDPKVEKSKTDDKSGAQEFTITYTNVHETATVDVSGVKEWNDDSNRDVVRPQSIYVTLTGTVDGEVVKTETKIVTSATAVEGNPNQWAYSFTGLDEFYNGGKTITYTITETDENGNEINNLPNYEAPEYFGDNNYSVRNTHTNEPTSLSGKKVWEDDGNRDALRPTTITVEVYDVDDPNTIVASKEVTGSMTGAEWSYEFTGLNKNKNVNGTKTPITYKVKEVNVPDGYTSKVEDDGTTITNTYTPEKTQISGKKVWVDDGNRDALRPTTITVEVYDVDDPNTVVASKEVSGDMTADEWSYTITGLPANKNVNGKATPITYKVKEVVVPDGYTSKVSDDGTTITNTHETDKVNVPVSKTWIDSDDKEKHRPTEITVYLYDDKDVKVRETKLNAENGWEYTFESLPANRNVNGVATPIVYRAEEVITDQIREFYDVDVVENTAIINTIKDLSKDIPVAKIWNDANNQDGKRKPVTITLSGTITDKDENVINVETDKVPKTITLTEEDLDPNDPNRWVGVFENVPIFYQGSWITYQITEADVADYSVTAYGTEDDGTLTVTNTHQPEQAVYSASKVWNDDDDNDDRRPDNVTFALMAGENEVQRLVASEENGWKVTFDAVPVYKEGAVGQKITYTVTEPELDSNYTMSEDIATGETEYDFIITNDHEPMTITYNVQKIWDDWDNQSGDRPESITVRIYESTDLENEVASQVITEASGWSCTFDGLPKYRNKQLIQYVITEDNVDLYKEPIITQVEQERDTTELNNTVTNPKDRVPYNDTGEITVNKYWKDEENKYKKRPKSVTIELLADGEVIATADLTEANEWTYTFTGLWKYKEGEVGVEIKYSIRELAVEYYKTTIDGFDVYNTYDGPVPEITPPNTGVMMVKDNNNNVLFEMIATVLATSYTIVVARRRNEQ